MSAQMRQETREGNGGDRRRILILFQNDSFPDDTRVRLEAQTLCNAGYQVCVICPTGTSRRFREDVAGVHVYRYPKPWEMRGLAGYALEYAYTLGATFLLSLYVAVRHGFDAIHARTPPDFYALIAAVYKLAGKRYVIDMNDLPLELYQAQQDGTGNRLVCGILRLFERWNCWLADRFIATSETQRRVQIERCQAPPDRCHLVRNVPSERFLEPVEPLPLLRGTGRIVIGYMGITGTQDRVDVMLHVLKVLKEDLRRSAFLGVIVGNGAALADLKRLAEELGLANDVHFAGYCAGEDLLRHVSSFDIALVPDPSNPYNNSCAMLKLMEYMAMGKPVIGFDLAENRVTAGDAALFVQNNDVAEFARQLARLMDDPKLRQRMGQMGRKRVRERLVWEHQQQELIRAYEQLFSQNEAHKAADASKKAVEPGLMPAAEKERVLV